MAKKPLPTPDELRQLLRYEPETGKLFWRARTPEMFADGGHTAAHVCARWNSKFSGKEAFTACSRGYPVGAIWGTNIQAHRAAWAIYHGEWPTHRIDHIDGNPGNNRIENLRDVTQAENMRNISRRSDNTSGATGVYWRKQRMKWGAYIKADKIIPLGSFKTFDEAVAARKEAEKALGYHSNHGRSQRPKGF